MEALAIIPARGGSKGLPGKNLRPLCGKPLIAWTIETARQAATVGRVVVSTDDPDIARTSRDYGAEVVLRPSAISGDTSPSEEALVHALQQLGTDRGILAFLQCTAPLTLPADVDGTVRLLAHADSAFTASPWHRFLWETREGGGPSFNAVPLGHGKSRRPMRQQMAGRYVEVGAVYAVSIPAFLRQRNRFAGRTALYPIPAERSIEIDDEVDFLLAETLLRRRLHRIKASRLPSPTAAVVVDFDGVLTDNRAIVDGEGREAVTCHRGDGWAVRQWKAAGLRVAVLTNELAPAVLRRCEKLGVPCLATRGPKLPVLQAWLEREGVDPASTVYVGNDAPDVPCMLYVGCAVAPSDAAPPAKAVAQVVLDTPGGGGCLRELAELLLARGEGYDGPATHYR